MIRKATATDIPVLKDKDIRKPLFDFLEEHYGKIRILEEKTMGRSRADIVMVMPEKLVGIEIKSDADTYTRLTRQVRDYDKYFDAKKLKIYVIILLKLLITNHIFSGGLPLCTIQPHNKNLNLTLTDTIAKTTASN